MIGNDFGGAGARETTCPPCGAALIESFHHGTTHRIAPARVTRDCPACGAVGAIVIVTARSHGRTGTAEVYRAALTPPWVRARLPRPYEEGSSFLRDLLRPAAAIPLGLAAVLVALWVRQAGWVNAGPVLAGLIGAGATFWGVMRVYTSARFRAWTKGSRVREDGALAVLLALVMAVMIGVVLAFG
jgi:hypothetical protein